MNPVPRQEASASVPEVVQGRPVVGVSAAPAGAEDRTPAASAVPRAYLTLLALVGLISGIAGVLVFGIVGLIFAGTSNFTLAGLAWGWAWLGLGLACSFQSVRLHSRGGRGVLLLGAAWMILLTLVQGVPRLSGIDWLLGETYPSLAGALLGSLMGLLASLGLIALTVVADGRSRQVWFQGRAGLGLGVLFLLLAFNGPPWLVPAWLRARAAREAVALRDAHPLRPEKKLLWGNALTDLAAGRGGGVLADLESAQAAGSSVLWLPIPGQQAEAEEGVAGCIRRARELGMQVVLADTPGSYRARAPLSWDAFERLQLEFLEENLRQFKPQAYLLCTGMLNYHRWGIIGEEVDHSHYFTDGSRQRRYVDLFLERWRGQLVRMARRARAVVPGLRVGVSFRPWIPEEWSLLRQVAHEEDIEILAFEGYSGAELEAIARELRIIRPQLSRKAVWLCGTFQGAPLDPARDAQPDIDWLAGVAGWAQAHALEAVFLRPLGRQVPGGGGQAVLSGALGRNWEAGGHKLSDTGDFWRALTVKLGRAWSADRPYKDF